MRLFAMRSLLLASLTGLCPVGQAAPPPDETIRGVYAQVLAQADTNQDGGLSVAECKAIFTDRKIAERSCRFWDANKDGVIAEGEYVERVKLVTSRKQ